jgi:nucleoside-diphosphate-sugar epimerase
MTKNEMGDVVVTGGSGAIGSRLVRRLLDEGARSVIVVDDLSSGYEFLLPDDPRVQLCKADVTAIDTLGIATTNPIVFHLAAFFANQNSVDHPKDDLHTNGLGTLATLVWSRDRNARRVVYASAGCSIAGHGIDAPIREDMPVSLDLDTPYQITKALGEFYCNYFRKEVSTVRCRFFNSYGPGEVPGNYRNVIPNFIWRALHDQPLTITGTGEETRDFIYVDDLVDGLMRSAQTPAADGEAFNLGTGIQTKVIDLAKLIIGECGSKSAIEYTARRSWDNSTHRQADIGRAQSVLGFKPATKIEEGIARNVAWFRENYDAIATAVKGAA